MDQLHLFSSFLLRGRPQPLVVWMHEEERTFLLPGDTAGNLEVTTDAALLVTNPQVQWRKRFFPNAYRSRISFAAGNRRRPAAISAGKRNATPVSNCWTTAENPNILL